MKYSAKTAHGDAGEFFFAYQIASVLRWPCRLFDIDIGVDAQIEVLEENGASTGKFVAFQIKTTTLDNHAACSYVRKKHLAYWRGLDVPFFAVLVDLPKQVMYLHQITRAQSYPVTEKGFVRIEFDTAKDRFTEATGARIKAAADEVALAAVREYLDPVRVGIETIRDALRAAEMTPEPQVLIAIMMRRTDWTDRLARAETLVNAYLTGEPEFLEVQFQLEDALSALREFMVDNNMDKDWDDGKYGAGEIKKFIDERD